MTQVMTPSMAPSEGVLADLLCFDLGAERFAIPLAAVEEMVDACDIEPTSGVGASIGVLRVRGELLPVYEATRVLRAGRSSAEPIALVLQGSQSFLALLVDAAEAATQVDMTTVRTPPALVSADRVLDGVLQVGARWVGLINHSAFVNALECGLVEPMHAGAHVG